MMMVGDGEQVINTLERAIVEIERLRKQLQLADAGAKQANEWIKDRNAELDERDAEIARLREELVAARAAIYSALDGSAAGSGYAECAHCNSTGRLQAKNADGYVSVQCHFCAPARCNAMEAEIAELKDILSQRVGTMAYLQKVAQTEVQSQTIRQLRAEIERLQSLVRDPGL